MNIALFSSPVNTVPPDSKHILAPWVLVGELAEGLVERGHNVTLFAPWGSKSRAKVIDGDIGPVIREKSSFSTALDYRNYVMAQSLRLFRTLIDYVKQHPVDVVHVHQAVEILHPALLDFPKDIPIVATFHDPVDKTRFAGLETIAKLGNVFYVGISNAQSRNVPSQFADTVYNGIDTRVFKPVASGNYENKLLVTGRIVPEKGFDHAIAAAKQANMRLMIVGQRYDDPKAAEYFDEKIYPLVDGKSVIWEPVVKRDHLVGHYQTARALLFPILWEEPFGLVMIEAMSCGTPVVAYNRGSVPEIVKDGVTGFIVDPDDENRPNKGSWIVKKQGIEGLVEALYKIDDIKREHCVAHVQKNFTMAHMIDRYVEVYKKIIAKNHL